jgi:hypothetical protein
VNRYIIQIPSDELYLHVGEEDLGPLTLNRVREMFQSHEISRATFLWFAGLEGWITVGDIPEFDRRIVGESNLPSFPPRAEDYIISLKGKVVPLKLEAIKALIEHHEYRRADLIFQGESDQWIRADQHPHIRVLFSNPPPPVFAKR